MTVLSIDAFEFVRQQERRTGQVSVQEFPRLGKESPGTSGLLQWSLIGGADKLGHPQLLLSVAVTVHPVCQRCLTAFSLDIVSESVLVLAKDEADADRIEAMLDNDDIEVIVGSKEMNLLDLIEDEVLLALPLSPRHEVCPDGTDNTGPKSGKPSPFDVLKNLKK